MNPQQSKISAFTVDDDFTVHEEIITEDMRALEFKQRVKDRLVLLNNKCTWLTSLVIYFHNVPMNSNMILHSDLRRVRARRSRPLAQRVIVAHDVDPQPQINVALHAGYVAMPSHGPDRFDLERELAALDIVDGGRQPDHLYNEMLHHVDRCSVLGLHWPSPQDMAMGIPWPSPVLEWTPRSRGFPLAQVIETSSRRDAPIGYLICHAACNHCVRPDWYPRLAAALHRQYGTAPVHPCRCAKCLVEMLKF